MEAEGNNQASAKISPNFRARLNHLEPTQKLRVIVFLRTPDNAPATRAATRAHRKALVERVRQAAKTALPDIDAILERFGAERLSQSVDALGSILVETTPAGIKALEGSE